VIEITVPSSFPEKYLKALIKVADQCAVKKAIMNPPKFEVKARVN
jgi:putative redox protein